jgi:glyoxylase-like metal-dependent hydrolase (beta-lactamase superfamily II)
MSASGSEPVHIEKNELYEVATNFWNIRVSFKMFAGFVDLGSQMSLIRLKNGKFLVIDTVMLTDQTRAAIDRLTENGTKIEAVIAVHPFHTLAFPAFYEAYPKAEYYGTPRHLRRLTQIPWVGSLEDCNIRKKWEPEVEMRIPAGEEFEFNF